MRISKAFAALFTLFVGVAALDTGHAATFSHRTRPTFSGPVALPGVVLNAGPTRSRS